MHIVGTKRVELTGLLSLLVALLIKCFFTCSAVRISTSVGNIGWGSSIGTNGFGPPEPLSARLNQADAHCVFSAWCGLRPHVAACRRVGMSMCVHSSVWVCFRTAPRRPDGGDDQDWGGWVAFADRLDETCGHSQPLAVSCVATPEPVWARSQSSKHIKLSCIPGTMRL